MENATRLSPLEHPPLPYQNVLRLSGRGLVGSCSKGVVGGASVPDSARSPGPARRVTRWRQLDVVEQHLLEVAVREDTIDHDADGSVRHADDVPATRLAGQRLLRLGLIGFYEVSDGYPDLIGAELERVLGDDSHWIGDDETSQRVGVYLTTAGEEIVLRLRRPRLVNGD